MNSSLSDEEIENLEFGISEDELIRRSKEGTISLEKLRAEVKEARIEIAEGKVYSEEEIRKELNL